MNRYAACLKCLDFDLVWIAQRRGYIRAEEITIGSNRLLQTAFNWLASSKN